jgi:pimeloyl-ACP methyl ester carboxylesterase
VRAPIIKAILKDHGIEPAPQRRTKMPWKTFLAAHWDGLAAADFFTVEVLTMTGLVRYVALFVMKLKTRTVEISAETLIVFGDRDPLYPVSLAFELKAAIPGSHLWVIPNAGHGPVFGDSAPRFAETAASFLRVPHAA